MLEAENERPPIHLTSTDDVKSVKQASRRDTNIKDIELQLWNRQEPVVSSTVYKGFQTCGRDPVKETWDYSEFIVSDEEKKESYSSCTKARWQVLNLLLALGGLYVLVKRQRLLAGQHQAMLARRIGRI